jgi:hypothetical protein
MNNRSEEQDAAKGWLTVLSQLSRAGTPHELAAAARAPAKQFDPANVGIRPVEQLTARTATVDWCESGVCRYAEQTWIRGVAKRNGICALTGAQIRRGDPVYRPRSIVPAPTNALAMIAAEPILALPFAWRP